MLDTLAQKVPKDKDYPDRVWQMEVLARVLDGTLYNVLSSEFHAEKNGAGEYVPLRERRPSVRYGLCRMVVEDSIAFLFGEGRWPAAECVDRATQDRLADMIDESNLSQIMQEAALQGSVGSVAMLLRILGNRPFWTPMATAFLTPEWKPDAPDTLLRVTERYKLTGQVLSDSGYTIANDDLAATFWFQRQWDQDSELWFLPQKLDSQTPMALDAARSVTHTLGFVPIAWIKNLPGGTALDGPCTFRPAVETSIEIDYQLSQAGRGLKYSADPLLLIKEPAAPDEELVRSAGNALVVSEHGDAKLLEISGTAATAVIEYVRALREMALESVHGNRANADRMGAAQSGRAMELLYAPLINLADRMRVTYGRALMNMCHMMVKASQVYALTAYGKPVGKLNQTERVTLRWPPWFSPTHQDRQAEAVTLGSLRREGLMSQPTGLARTAETWDIGDVAAELAAIKADEVAADARAIAQGAQIQDKQMLPA